MSKPFVLSMPDELLELVQLAAKETHLSQQDVIRQTIKLGMPKLREQFGLENLIADTWEKLGPAPEVDYDKL